MSLLPFGFNPHTHAGCDRWRTGWLCLPAVSIHTPTQGVTLVMCYGTPCIRVSIHTPTQGVTVLCPDHVNDLLVSIHTPTQGVTPYWLSLTRSGSFNPHTHAGCDPGCSISPWSSWSFNPHTHAGCDSLSKVYDKRLQVSIHTPTQGVTYTRYSQFTTIRFQSTHPRRV